VNNLIGLEPVGFITVLGSANLNTANQRDNGFDSARTIPLNAFAWNPPAASSALGAWPQADTNVMPANYVPAGTQFADYLDDRTFLAANLAQVGIITPANETEAAQLRARWQTATAPR